MTQAAVNSAKVLYRLSVSREDVEKAEKLFFMTPQLQKVLTSPVVPAAKKYEIIDQVFALETTEDVLVRYMKIMCRIGNMTEMQDIFQYYYKYWDQMHHVVRADLIYAETPSKAEEKEAKAILDKNYPPLVSDNGMSNALKAPAIDTKRLIVIVGINNGNWI